MKYILSFLFLVLGCNTSRHSQEDYAVIGFTNNDSTAGHYGYYPEGDTSGFYGGNVPFGIWNVDTAIIYPNSDGNYDIKRIQRAIDIARTIGKRIYVGDNYKDGSFGLDTAIYLLSNRVITISEAKLCDCYDPYLVLKLGCNYNIDNMPTYNVSIDSLKVNK